MMCSGDVENQQTGSLMLENQEANLIQEDVQSRINEKYCQNIYN